MRRERDGDGEKPRTTVVFAVVIDHEHHLPLEDVVVVDEAT